MTPRKKKNLVNMFELTHTYDSCERCDITMRFLDFLDSHGYLRDEPNEKAVGKHYDKDGDMLYVSFGKPEPATTVETGDGVLLRFNPHSLEFVGMDILDYERRKLKWLKHCIKRNAEKRDEPEKKEVKP